MFDPIPFLTPEPRLLSPDAWHARAAQARRVAGTLSPSDASILEAYALECEAAAALAPAEHAGQGSPRIAA